MARLVAAASSLLQFRLALLSLLAASSLALLPHLPDGDVVDENILGKGAPQPLSFPDAVRLLQLLQLQQQEGQDQSAEGRAQLQDARFMSITDGGYFRGGECHSRSTFSPIYSPSSSLLAPLNTRQTIPIYFHTLHVNTVRYSASSVVREVYTVSQLHITVTPIHLTVTLGGYVRGVVVTVAVQES